MGLRIKEVTTSDAACVDQLVLNPSLAGVDSILDFRSIQTKTAIYYRDLY